MSNKPSNYISTKQVKRNFNTIGLFLIIYVLIVLILPYFMNYYFNETSSSILDDEFLFFGIYFIIILFGTLVPFFLMRKANHLPLKKMNRKVNASFLDLFIQTIVFFTSTIALTFISNIAASYISLDSKLICSIGFDFDDIYLGNILYVFMIIVVTPIIEEYAFRGVLLNVLGKYGKRFALIASSIIFALAHVNISEMLPAFAMGYALSKTSLKYKSIQPTILIHILFNGFLYLLFIMPSNIARYMTYGLAAICIVAIILLLSGRYQRIIIQKSNNTQKTMKLFFLRPSVIIAIILMIANTLLFLLLK